MEPILVAEPDLPVARAVQRALTEERFEVRLAESGTSALAELERTPSGLLLLSLELPDIRGAEVLRRVRRSDTLAQLPVIALSTDPDEVDRVLAFELGVDDFVSKPASMRELVLRVKAVLRRVRGKRRAPRPEVVRVGRLTLLLKSREAKVAGRKLQLTRVESRLLSELAAQPGRVWRREELLHRVWPEVELDPRTVDTHVRRLREKLGNDSEVIETVRGVGYRLRSADGSAQSPLT
ncbi:MAG: DNA-binding response regulator [Sandaracinus sp.]|nr:DNA-binding response regulator [Sandaracinus sp.]